MVITDKLYTEVNEDFNKAMMYMHKMPKIWLAYCSFLMRQKKITATRRVFDRALQSLPITQHDMIWDLYIRFVKDCGVLETAACVYRRYILVEPSAVEEFIEWVFARLLTVRYLVAVGKYGEAAVQLCRIINDEKYQSRDGTTKQQLWNELMDILVKHPESITSIRIDSVIRNGIKRFPQEQGRWWCMFAEYYNRLNNNEKARDMWAIPAVLRRSYEEAIQSVSSVRDFSMVYDAYVQSEMRLLEVLMGAEADEAESDEEPLLFGDEDPADADLADLNPEASDLGLRRERLEHLIDAQPVLLNNVRLRQNPHEVKQWLYRVSLFMDPKKGAVKEADPARAVVAFTEAVKTIDPLKAVGKVSTVWIEFAKFYEQFDDLENACRVFEKAVKVEFKSVEELATVWCAWIEMYLRHDRIEEAYQAALRATAPVRGVNRAEWANGARLKRSEGVTRRPPQERLYKSTKVWNMLVDLEESIGTMETTRAAYDRMFDLKIITPQVGAGHGREA